MISYFARHPTAANLLMLLLISMGLFSISSLRRETFPDFSSNELEIRIPYPGAGADEVEETICQRVEDALDGVRSLKEIRADAREGIAIVVVEMKENGNFQEFKDDVETEIDAIDDFPQSVEDPVITQLGTKDLVLEVLVSGDMPERDLKAYCEDLKDRLQLLPPVSLITISGFSDHQFRIELNSNALLMHGLSVTEVADRVSRQSVDLPAGAIEARERDILIRFMERRRSIRELEELVVLANPGAGEVRLGQLGKVIDLFDVSEDKVQLNGRRAGLLQIKKTKQQDTIRVSSAVKEFLKTEHTRLPDGMELVINRDVAVLVQDRLDMLVRNGWQGMILVFLAMWFFFSFKFSFWVAMGLPISFLGAFFFMPHLGLTINMLTMVGMLLALGLLMDDAIVIAENIASHLAKGKAAMEAAVAGVSEVKVGVFSSFVTTICVLGPLAYLEGDIGKVLKVVPVILLLVLTVSLIEAFCILPAHLGHALRGQESATKTKGFRAKIDRSIDWFRENVYGRIVDTLLRWRYLTAGAVVGIFLMSIGMLAGGHLKFKAFPDLEGDVIAARVLLPQGTPLARTEKVVKQITDGLKRVNQKRTPLQPDGQPLIKSVYVQFNQNSDAFENGPHVATITADLLSAEVRNGLLDDILEEWRAEAGMPADVLNLSFTEPTFGPAGRAIEIRLGGPDLKHLKTAGNAMKDWFSRFEGVSNLSDDLRPGKPEVQLRAREVALGLGLDVSTMARQLRASFYGATADEIQVGKEAYEVNVRLDPSSQNSLADLAYFHFTLPNGQLVPLDVAAEVNVGRGWARIARVNGQRTVTIRGDIDSRKANTAELFNLLQKTYLPEFQRRFPNVAVSFEGEIKEAAITQGSIKFGALIGMIGLYLLLSFQFRSYIEPFIVMVAIPFGLIGVIWGHLFMGVNLAMPSMLGFASLAGVVVNDSILLVMFLKLRKQDGGDASQAAAQAGRERFRAVMLTSLTTIAGLVPLLSETSLQAQILIPLAISIVFGLMASTVLVLLVIPCLYTILHDLKLVK